MAEFDGLQRLALLVSRSTNCGFLHQSESFLGDVFLRMNPFNGSKAFGRSGIAFVAIPDSIAFFG
jgi:hypothetical protein